MLFNAKPSLHILNIYHLVWFGFMTYQPLHVILCQILFIHIYQIYMICKHIFLITFLNEPGFIFGTQLNGFKYFYLIGIILLTICYLFAPLSGATIPG